MIATHRRSRDHRPKWSRSRCGRSFRYSQASGSRAVVLGACAGPMAWRQSHLHSEAHADTIKKRERFPPRSSVHSALGYRSPEEFEQQIEASGSAESRSATMVFSKNKQNDERDSTRFLGKETQMPSPSPDPSPARRCKNAFTKAEAVSKKTVPL